MARTPIIIGNWKMHMLVGEALELARSVRNVLGGISGVEAGVAPPLTALHAVAKQEHDSKLIVAAQNCHFEAQGAFTGEVSVKMIADTGASHVIVGHSERRQIFGESDELVGKKVTAVLAGGLTPVLCIGETLAQREAKQTFDVVARQLQRGLAGVSANNAKRVIVAYEPVWAIGTGKVATTAQAQEVHAFLRGQLGEHYDAGVAKNCKTTLVLENVVNYDVQTGWSLK